MNVIHWLGCSSNWLVKVWYNVFITLAPQIHKGIPLHPVKVFCLGKFNRGFCTNFSRLLMHAHTFLSESWISVEASKKYIFLGNSLKKFVSLKADKMSLGGELFYQSISLYKAPGCCLAACRTHCSVTCSSIKLNSQNWMETRGRSSCMYEQGGDD